MTLSEEEARLHQQRRERIVRVKRVLRWMPRKATLHKYPVLRWFAAAAIRRSYIWSFRVPAAVPALYAGSIITFLPLYGIQIPLAVLAAFALRANLPILASLQFISNPLTILPIYYTAFQIGKQSLNLIRIHTPQLTMAEMKQLLQINDTATVIDNLNYVAKVFLTTSLGGAILGTFVAAIAATFYKAGAKEVTASYNRLRELQRKRHERIQAAESNSHDAAPGNPTGNPDLAQSASAKPANP